MRRRILEDMIQLLILNKPRLLVGHQVIGEWYMNNQKRYAFLIMSILFVLAFAAVWKSGKNDSTSADIMKAFLGSNESLKSDKNYLYDIESKKQKNNFEIHHIEELVLNADFISQEEIQQIGKMQSLKKLAFLIDDENIDLSPLAKLINLEELEIQSCIGECCELDTQPLGELENLKEISLMYCSFDTSFLKELSGLEKVFILKCDKIEDLSAFGSLSKLRDLYIEYVNDSDLKYLHNLTKLEKIHIVGGNIRNFEGLKNMVNMKEVYLVENSYEMQHLDMSIFEKMVGLKNILIAHIYINDISPLSDMKDLEYISLINTGITDVQPLADLKQLKYLDIFGNDSKLVEEQIEKYFADVETVHISSEIPYPFSG